jgi:hypothetical protein
MGVYAAETNGRYPTPEKWCDLLIETKLLGVNSMHVFVCPGTKEGRCSYAINPNAEPNSPSDMVLLFETKDGWNQFGGPELLTTENHRPRGCHVLFADLSVRFIKPDELGRLKWSADANDS